MSPQDARSEPAAKLSNDSLRSRRADSVQALHMRAEVVADERAGEMPENREVLSPEAARRVLHELRVHEIELEMQNEELRRAQEELEVSRERYFDLYDLAPVGYFTLSEPGLILNANLTAAKMLGVARSVLVTQPLSRFVVREDQDIYYLHRRALLANGAPQRSELRMLKQDGQPFWARLEATTARGADGSSVCRTVVSDITESKHVEQLLQTHSAELQEFAYALTHDLQEPLRMVVAFNQLLAKEYEGKLGDAANDYIAFSVEGALRIEALLKGLLNYLEIADRDGDGLAPVDCNDVLSQALLSLQTAVQQSSATVTSGPLPTVLAKEATLLQIFRNLIGNSMKYRSEAAPVIHISAVRTAEGWLFSVRDNGIGIDPAHAELVFGMFKRLHGKEIPGTGIGLALCKKIVERQGGRIWLESAAGRGTIFKFTIPTPLAL